MSIISETIYQLNRLRGFSHFAGQIRTGGGNIPSETVVNPQEMSYHTFRDLGIEGIFDIEPHLPLYQFPELNGKDVLDVGCASGFFSRHFAQKGARVTSVDIDTRAVRKLNDRERTGLNIIDINCFDLQYENQFDMVFCGSLLLHVLDPIELVRILHRALRPGGRLVIASAALKSSAPVLRIYPRRALRSATSTDEAIWWISAPAQITMLENAGFEKCQTLATFVLASTRFACARGYRCSLRHNVYHAIKP